jgi:hypothetical protein
MNVIAKINNSYEVFISGDGNCFFRSIIKGLKKNIDNTTELEFANRLRKIIYKLLKDEQFVEKEINGITIKAIIESDGISVSNYAKDILKGKYGGEIEAFILAHHLKIRIVLHFRNNFTKRYEKTIYNGNDGTNDLTINLKGYISSREFGNHYNLIIPHREGNIFI